MRPKHYRLFAALILAAIGTGAVAQAAAGSGPVIVPDQSASPHRAASPADDGWIIKATDNICGLSEKRMLSRPARVDWPTLLDETPEVKDMKKRGIDPNSPEGIQIRQRARERLTKACKSEMEERGFCSVWKSISHRDGRDITDLTSAVRVRLGQG